MELLWYLDRASALVSYPLLYLAVFTGVLYNTDDFGVLQSLAQRVHIELSVLATIMMLLHGVLGTADAYLITTGAAPAPDYPMWYFVGGVVAGAGALLILVVAVLGFVDARRFARPWGPRTVHAFAYAGYGFATVHMVAVGTDISGRWRVGALAGLGVLVYVLLLRLLLRVDLLTTESPSSA